MHVESVKGLQEIVIYRIENGKEVEAYREKMHGEKILDYPPKFDFTAADYASEGSVYRMAVRIRQLKVW